jgi:Flp pilus assembly protein TadG
MTMINRLLRAATITNDRSGIAIVEFALLVPVLLTLFIGSFETANLLLAYLKLEDAAETASDLVAQTNPTYVLQSTDITNITSAVKQVMNPLPTTGLTVAYASITYSGCSTTCTAKVDWTVSVPAGSAPFGAAGATATNLPNGAATSTLGASNTDSVIVVQLTYAYKSPVSYVLATNWTLTESAFNRPRYQPCIPTYLNTNNICP